MTLSKVERPRIVWTRVTARFMFVNAVMAFAFSIFSQSYTRITIISQLSRVICYLFFFVLSRVRKKRDFYVPILNEMSEEDYWGFVALSLVVLRLVITGGSADFGSIFRAVDIIFGTIGVTHVFMIYARRGWTLRQEHLREKRIQFLTRKAKINKKELENVKGTLVEAVRTRQRTPVTWSIALWCISFIIGLLMNEYVSYATEQIHHFGINLKDIMPSR